MNGVCGSCGSNKGHIEGRCRNCGGPFAPRPTPYLAFGNDELNASPPLHSGEAILCPTCGESHVVVGGIDRATGEETETLLFYQCGDTSFLAGIDGKNVMARFMKGG